MSRPVDAIFIRRGSVEIRNERMIKEMPYLAEHLSSLRQEIGDLQKMNARYSNRIEHSPLDQSALEMRTARLLQIKKELAGPDDPKPGGRGLTPASPSARPSPEISIEFCSLNE
jgi:hypothetical protein